MSANSKTKTLVKSILKSSKTKVLACGALSIGGASMAASPSFAASVDLSSWNQLGDATTNSSNANLTNAFNDGSDDGGTNYNITGISPEFISVLESGLGLNPGDLGADATEGSAISKLFTGVQAGDVFSFDWVFNTYDNVFSDRAFVRIGNFIQTLAAGTSGSSNFSYTFASAGDYDISIGVVDVDDFTVSSTLDISNVQFTPADEAVPEPLTILGTGAAAAIGAVMRRRLGKKAEA
ncbi:MAG: PEP-CTERM sorting domain-containing protein [Calothrix sp. C42_A2020_038]|nr:PEP-CTERM sorting domain-containing protein [Calothrix sp. C42_A2020_038]